MKYTGTKTVDATPMTRGEYNNHRDWNTPANEDPSDAGYLVEYLDGGKPNHPDHANYISWSPADVFERSYFSIAEPRFKEAWQQRVLEEAQDLAKKLDALKAFKSTGDFLKIYPGERGRLMAQAIYMQGYLDTLNERIAAFVPSRPLTVEETEQAI